MSRSSTEKAAEERVRFRDENVADSDALINGLSPMLKIMTVSGTYFKVCYECNKVCTRHASDAECGKPNGQWSRNFGSKYAIATSILLWINAIRLLSSFTADEKLGTLLINKLILVAVAALCATVHTAYYIATRYGYLDRVLREVRVTTDFANQIPKLVTRFIIFNVFSTVSFMCLLVNFLYFTHGPFDFLSAPFNAYMVDKTWMYAVKLIVLMLNILGQQALMWTFSMGQILIELFHQQFKLINRQFRLAINRRGKLNESLKVFRNRHHALSKEVRICDSFVRVVNVSCCCQMFVIVVVLYALIFINNLGASVIGAYSAVLFASVLGLSSCVGNAMKINQEAHKLNDKIHNVDLNTLTIEEVSELLMFQRRLSGEPIGFSILGMVVINKTTVPAILSLLLTYFLLIIQLTTKSHANDVCQCSCDTNCSTELTSLTRGMGECFYNDSRFCLDVWNQCKKSYDYI